MNHWNLIRVVSSTSFKVIVLTDRHPVVDVCNVLKMNKKVEMQLSDVLPR